MVYLIAKMGEICDHDGNFIMASEQEKVNRYTFEAYSLTGSIP